MEHDTILNVNNLIEEKLSSSGSTLTLTIFYLWGDATIIQTVI